VLKKGRKSNTKIGIGVEKGAKVKHLNRHRYWKRGESQTLK